jgi:hypothetical protein
VRFDKVEGRDDEIVELCSNLFSRQVEQRVETHSSVRRRELHPAHDGRDALSRTCATSAFTVPKRSCSKQALPG